MVAKKLSGLEVNECPRDDPIAVLRTNSARCNGGFAGSIGYKQLAAYLERGFAVAGTDAGHQAEATDASWAYRHPEKVKDFGLARST